MSDSSVMERVTAEELRVGDVIKHGAALMTIIWIDEFPKMRVMGLRCRRGPTYTTGKRRSTTVQRWVPNGGVTDASG